MSYPGHSLGAGSYPSAEVQSVYSTAPVLLLSLLDRYPKEKFEPPYPPSNGLNSTTAVLLEGWIWHLIPTKVYLLLKKPNQIDYVFISSWTIYINSSLYFISLPYPLLTNSIGKSNVKKKTTNILICLPSAEKDSQILKTKFFIEKESRKYNLGYWRLFKEIRKQHLDYSLEYNPWWWKARGIYLPYQNYELFLKIRNLFWLWFLSIQLYYRYISNIVTWSLKQEGTESCLQKSLKSFFRCFLFFLAVWKGRYYLLLFFLL